MTETQNTAENIVNEIRQRKHPLAECESCPLQTRPCAPTSGDPNSRIAFVSRSPGKHDVMARRPFAGPSGKVLDYLLGKHGVKREEILLTNVVLCQSDDPPKEAIAACKPRLEAEIANCDLVIAGGTEATSVLTRYRAVHTGRPFSHTRDTSEGVSQRVVVTNNPALVIRNSDAFPDMVEDFNKAFNPLPPPTFPDVEVINEADRATAAIERWIKSSPSLLSSDLEWRSTDGTPVCAGFAARGEKAVVFGLRAISDGRCWDALKRLYENPDIRFAWHNGKSDTEVLIRNGINARVDEDTHLMSYALDERPGYHSLEYLLSTKFGWPDYEPKEVKEFKRTGELDNSFDEQQLYKYNGWDTAGTYQLLNTLNPLLDADNVRELYLRLLHAVSRIRQVELNGFHFDVEESLNIYERESIPRLAELTENIREASGHSLLNPNSPKQLQSMLYGEWGLKHNLRDAGKKKLSKSTGKEVREIIERGEFNCNPGVRESLVQWGELQTRFSKVGKLSNTYLKGLALRAKDTGVIYCNFNLGGTVSGRASSNDPNLQNIAREGYEEIPGIRTLFLPSPGNVIISADFSQAELRTCAKLSGDKNLLGIYRDSSRSLHRERATAFYGDSYTYEQYVKAKNINFGVTYGQGADSFAQMYNMPKNEAQDYITSWWTEFSTLKEWTNDLKRQGRKDGYVQSPFGHKRRFYLITDENVGDVERESVSFLPQNIAAWLTLSAVCDLIDADVRVIATVHDSIVADVPVSQRDSVANLMKKVMEAQAIKILGWTDIPFLVDVSVGPNWGTLEELELVT